MEILFVFSLTLVGAVLISELAGRTILSTAVLFLLVGLGSSIFSWFQIGLQTPFVLLLPEVALIAILFSDAMNLSFQSFAKTWRLAFRALVIGLPLTLLITAVIIRFVFNLHWLESLLIGAILSPTDPVFAAALVRNEKVPSSLRDVLNIESGLNDGLSLPLVLILLHSLTAQQVEPFRLAKEIVIGLLIGAVTPWLFYRLEKIRLLGISGEYRPLFAVSVLFLVFSLAKLFHANEFLAAFGAGVILTNLSSITAKSFHPLGEPVSEILKLASVLVFGSFLSWHLLSSFDLRSYLGAFAVLFLARPIALQIALYGSSLSWRERLVAAWFGPKGFASVLFSLIVLKSGYSQSSEVFQVTALVIALSIVLHSSSDVLAARWLQNQGS